jgi:hypothetical protein
MAHWSTGRLLILSRVASCGLRDLSFIAGLLWGASWLGPPASADVLHVYDRLNRLRATVDTTANDAAIWTYDPVGNILSITRQAATQTTILELPADSVAGECGVRILGIGFSLTPSENVVTVNGVSASVQAATATELIVCLAAGTTTGPVAVTTPTGSASSAGPLPVQAVAAVPTVSAFTPIVATWGTELSVSGTNFDAGPGHTRIRLGGTELLSPVSNITETALTVTVPPATTSGRLRLTTPAGSAIAPSDLFVPLAPYTPADVAIAERWVRWDRASRSRFPRSSTPSCSSTGAWARRSASAPC